MNRKDIMPPSDLRIACLMPSATSICLALGLRDFLVGVTHECAEALQLKISNHSSSSSIRVLTSNGLTADSSQGEIHQAVQEAARGACSSTKKEEEIPSLYPLLQEELDLAKPTIIFTQDLCAVCAPTTADVRKCLLLLQENTEETTTTKVTIVSLQPTNLHQVADNFVAVAEACGVLDRGLALKEEWTQNFSLLQTTIEQYRDVKRPPPRMLILEWLDPPFDSGHWTYQMMEYACVQMAKPKINESKSKPMEWKEIHETDPDIIVVGCCGFDLERNVRDALVHQNQLVSLRAAKEKRLFACNGNIYIVEPGPALLQGAVVLAQCAYHDQPRVIEAIAKLNLIPPSEGWQQVDVSDTTSYIRATETPKDHSILTDIEDLGGPIEDDGFAQFHQKACQDGKMTYKDPETWYQVFTELGHKKRGYCCGSGCRHCPFGHENVKDKTSRIQQPAILHRQESNSLLFSLNHQNVKVLFFSGGKDSLWTSITDNI
jgi:iron complex transport system substrate-binding protein